MKGLWANAGDVFFTHGEGTLSKLIRWAESDPGETNGVWANHAGVVVKSGWMTPPDSMRGEIPAWPALAVVVEALGHVVEAPWWTSHAAEVEGKGYQVRVFRPVPPLDEWELKRLQAVSRASVGAKYGWWKLLAHLADRALFAGQKRFSVLLHVGRRPICSYLAAVAFDVARPIGSHLPNGRITGWMFGMLPQSADPDEMMDYCLAHPDEWEEVKESC